MDKGKRLEQLLEQMRIGDHETALDAAIELRKYGWLIDESLRGANLNRVSLPRCVYLRGAYLREASLRESCLSEADLSKADLREVDLSGADLSGANLTGADLSHADLSRADLRRANLWAAHLIGTSLQGANLSETTLSRADVIEANLSHADLSRAGLTEASLIGVRFFATNFTEATFGSTIIADVDLSEARGLETLKHNRFSYISIDTFYRSRGKIPLLFLKGCGVEDDFIEHILPITGNVIEFYSCFISYSHAEKNFAQRLHDRLQREGIRCWLDEHQMKPGHDIYEEVNRGIRLWDKVLLCCSKESLNSWWVDNEIGTALEKEQELTKERSKKILSIIPLNLDGYLFSKAWVSGYAAQIRRRLAADFRNWKDHDAFEAEFQKVLTIGGVEDG